MKKSKYRMSGGKMTEVGKERTVEQYKDYVKRMFGGGSTSAPSTQRHRAKGMAVGGKTTKGYTKGGKTTKGYAKGGKV
jgi:hypothetical protein